MNKNIIIHSFTYFESGNMAHMMKRTEKKKTLETHKSNTERQRQDKPY